MLLIGKLTAIIVKRLYGLTTIPIFVGGIQIISPSGEAMIADFMRMRL
jgi:hypothetical protein